MLGTDSNPTSGPDGFRDIFLSHRSTDKDFVWRLAADIEAETFQGRKLMTWVDEAEIPPGESDPGAINEGLEKSRFLAPVMTPDYFRSESGWTDAEWHAALHQDPDNRRGRIIPLLVKDCPYIPVLLRHLNMIDFRGNQYGEGLQRLLRVLRDEPLPRPVAHRGQLITPIGRIDHSTLIAERAVPEADPDVVEERLYCNLLPVERIPQYVYTAPIAKGLRRPREDGSEALPSKHEIKDAIRAKQKERGTESAFMPAFRAMKDRIITFHDLEAPDGPLAGVIEDENIKNVASREMLRDENDRKVVMSLLNMAVSRHCGKVGLIIDETKPGRFFFPPRDGGPNTITWRPGRTKTRRTVAKPCMRNGQVLFWLHQGAYLEFLFLANALYLKITPTWVLTEDGFRVKTGPGIGRWVIKWTGPERNPSLLYHVRFWISVMCGSRQSLSIRAGHQQLELSARCCFVQQSWGIADDQRDPARLLDQEAPLIAEEEDELAQLVEGAEQDGSHLDEGEEAGVE
jgi:hypothetical protein